MSRLDGRLRRLERARPPICPVCGIDPRKPPRFTAESFRPKQRGERVHGHPCPACHRPPVFCPDFSDDGDAW